jgi:large subunit ribosomal protein L9
LASADCGLIGVGRSTFRHSKTERDVDRVRSDPILVTLQPDPLTGFDAETIMPSTEIILTENIPGLGAEADVVKVRRGYARNYLLPQGKGYEVTPASLRKLDNLKKKRAEREARELNEAEELGRRIGKLRVTFALETGETGKAFGSITAQDIVTRIKQETGQDVDRHKVALERPIKDTGEHEVAIKLHHEVTAQFKFDVKSAEAPRNRVVEETADESSEKKHRSFFRRKKETK